MYVLGKHIPDAGLGECKPSIGLCHFKAHYYDSVSRLERCYYFSFTFVKTEAKSLALGHGTNKHWDKDSNSSLLRNAGPALSLFGR